MIKQEKQYYPSGKLMVSYFVGKDGNSEGTYTEYYENGTTEAEGIIIDNRKEGIWHFYHEDGGLQAKGEFNRGYKNGHWIYNMNKLPKTFNWSIYIEPDTLFGINYPTDWQIHLDPDVKLFAAFENVADGSYGSNFSVLCKTLSQPVILKDYFRESISQQIQNTSQKIEIVLPISHMLEINKLESYYCVMKTLNSEQQPINFIEFQIVNGLNLFVVNFFCLESKISVFEKIFDEIIFSFRSPF